MSTEDVSDSVVAFIFFGLQSFLFFFFSAIIFLPVTIRLKRLFVEGMLSLLKCCGSKSVPENDEGIEGNSCFLAAASIGDEVL